MASFNIVIVTTCNTWSTLDFRVKRRAKYAWSDAPEPTPPIMNDLTALMVGNCLADAIAQDHVFYGGDGGGDK